MSSDRKDYEILFTPHFPVLLSCVRQAFTRFFEINRDELGAIHNRTKSSYINDLVVKNLKQALPEQLSPLWENKGGQRRVWLAGSVCLRVKKVNQDLSSNNIATQAQFEFYASLTNPQSRFSTMPPPIPLVLGFTMNRTKTAPDKVFLIHAEGVLNGRHGRGVERIKPIVKWAILVTDAETGVPTVNLPLMPLPQPDTTPQRRVRAKDTTKAIKNIRKSSE